MRPKPGVFGFFDLVEVGMENVRHYRAMASMCTQRAALDLENGWIWLPELIGGRAWWKPKSKRTTRRAIPSEKKPAAA
jgi:hypothetical protein